VHLDVEAHVMVLGVVPPVASWTAGGVTHPAA